MSQMLEDPSKVLKNELGGVCLLGVLALVIPFEPSPALAEGGLTNSDVVALVTAGLSESVIIERITLGPTDFSLEVSDLIRLREAGVPNSILEKMLEISKPNEPANEIVTDTSKPRLRRYIRDIVTMDTFLRGVSGRDSVGRLTLNTATGFQYMPSHKRASPLASKSWGWADISRISFDDGPLSHYITITSLRQESFRFKVYLAGGDIDALMKALIGAFNRAKAAGVPELESLEIEIAD